MRDIKFRAWDGDIFHWMDDSDSEFILDGGRITVHGRFDGGTEIKNWIIEQYTGLKDSEGVDIYEGDICRFHGVEELATVLWDDFLWAWGFDDGYKLDFGEFISSDIEVIGNRHQGVSRDEI